MAISKLRQFDRQLQKIVQPALAEHGFILHDRRTFYREVEHDETKSIQFIEFQIGRKSRFAGQFTVNLAIYNESMNPGSTLAPNSLPGSWDCPQEMKHRLGFFYQPTPGFWSRFITRKAPVPYDHWWDQSSSEVKMAVTLQQVTELIVAKGLPWINEHTSRTAFNRAMEEMESRRKWKRELEATQLKWKSSLPPVVGDELDRVAASHPAVAIQFWATWNRADLLMEKNIRAIEGRFAGRVTFMSCDIDRPENLRMCKRLGVLNVPCVAVLVGGRPGRLILGLSEPEELARRIEAMLSGSLPRPWWRFW